MSLLPEAPPLVVPPLMVPPVDRAEPVPAAPLVKLDLACGQNKQEGFVGVDFVQAEGVDQVWDLNLYPWPWEDNSVDEIHCSHYLEHIPGLDRPRFMEEVYRILKVGGKATFITPYATSTRAIQDFSHAWPPVCAETYLYFNRAWREMNKLTHGWYNIRCDFDFSFPQQSLDPEVNNRAAEVVQFWAKHYNNVVQDLWAVLVKRG